MLKDDGGSEADAPLCQKGLRRAHVLDESSGSEDKSLGEGKSSVSGSSSTTDVPKKKSVE